MTDIVDPQTRSRMMANIRGKDTTPELYVRAALSGTGFSFLQNCRELPGSPDIVLPELQTAIFVHGCFWHVHGCSLSKMPTTNRTTWEEKLLGNRRRDNRTVRQLRAAGWRVFTIWECRLIASTRRVVLELERQRRGSGVKW